MLLFSHFLRLLTRPSFFLTSHPYFRGLSLIMSLLFSLLSIFQFSISRYLISMHVSINLYFSLSLTLTLSSLSHLPSLYLLSLTYPHSLTYSHSLFLSLTLSPSLPLSLSYSLTVFLSLSLLGVSILQGRVVGVIRRNWRQYAGSLDLGGSGDKEVG